MADIFNMADTWNDGATVFYAVKMDVTDTLSAAGSMLCDFGVGGVSRFSVAKLGDISFGNPATGSVTLSTKPGVALTVAATAPAATTGASVAGKAVSITAAPAVASTDTAGAAAGADVTIQGSDAARLTSGNADGGNVILKGGAGIGTGVTGQVKVTNAGTAARPAIHLATSTSTGWYQSTSDAWAFSAGGTALLQFSSGTIRLVSTGHLGWSSSAPTAPSDTGILRAAAATLRTTNGAAGVGRLLSGTLVEASTAGSGAPNVLTDIESGTLLTNEGATAENYHTLPSAAAGLNFMFIVQDTDGIRLTAAAGDTIRVGATVSAAAGFIRCATVGTKLWLDCINGTEWIATAVCGTNSSPPTVTIDV